MTALPLPIARQHPNLADGSEAIVNIDRAICDLAKTMVSVAPRHQGTLQGLTERMADLVRLRGEIIDQELRRRTEAAP